MFLSELLCHKSRSSCLKPDCRDGQAVSVENCRRGTSDWDAMPIPKQEETSFLRGRIFCKSTVPLPSSTKRVRYSPDESPSQLCQSLC